MRIPKFNELILPILKLFADEYEHHRNDFNNALADEFNLTREDQQIRIKTGQSQFVSRINWALTFLKQGFLIESTRRGYYKITQRGKDVLSKNLKELDPTTFWICIPT
jgi:restriction system protein